MKRNGKATSVVDELEGDEVRLPLARLKVDPNNANTHDEASITAIMGSLRQFGQVERLVVRKRNLQIIGGDGRYEAMLRLGWTECDVKLVDLSKVQADALSITLNRTSELSEWNYQQVAEHLRAGIKNGIEWEHLGWLPHQQEPLLNAVWTPPAQTSLHQNGAHNTSVAITPEDRKVIDRAVARIRKLESDEGLPEGRAIRLICQAWLKSLKA